MNKLKRVIIVFLSILLVLTSMVSWVCSAVRLGVLSPPVYSELMPRLNAFDSIYEGYIDYMLQELKTQDIPAEIEGVPEDIVRTAIPKEDFNYSVGEFLGGTIGMLLYKNEEVIIPIQKYVDALYDTIENDPRVTESETNIQATMEWIVKYKLEIYALSNEGYDQTLSGLIYLIMGQNAEYWIETFFPYWGVRLSIATFAALGLLVVLFIVLMILNTEKRYRSIMLAKILCVVYAVINLFAALAIYILPNISIIFSRLEEYYKYIEAAKTIFNSFALILIIFAVLLLIISMILGRAQKKAYKKMPSYY